MIGYVRVHNSQGKLVDSFECPEMSNDEQLLDLVAISLQAHPDPCAKVRVEDATGEGFWMVITDKQAAEIPHRRLGVSLK